MATTREKIRRKDKKDVDIDFVEQLLKWQRLRNNQLEGTKYFCTLYPDINKQACKTCPEDIKESCLKRKREREYIHSQEATKANQRRKRKQDNVKHEILEISVKETYDDDSVTIEANEEDKKYPCGVMNFACPEKKKCKYGKKCKYKPH